MSPRVRLTSSLAFPWKCPRCDSRPFASSARQLAVGPEHPRYIDIPEPPQQSIPYHRPVKGVLPVPRDIFSDAETKDQSRDESIAEATPLPRTAKTPVKGSREEWKAKMSEFRRQNLREGIKTLRARQLVQVRRLEERSTAREKERERLLNRPEREDERLTAPSHEFDLKNLFKSQTNDPSREYRLQQKRDNLERVTAAKQDKRLDDLHTLYMNARDFIVTPEQLEKAIDEAFGTPENPVQFGTMHGPFDMDDQERRSIWATGKPLRIQDMLNRANKKASQNALDSAMGHTTTNKERIRRIAEKLTGGTMDAEARHETGNPNP